MSTFSVITGLPAIQVGPRITGYYVPNRPSAAGMHSCIGMNLTSAGALNSVNERYTFRENRRVNEMDVELGMRLMQLYQALRGSRDPKERDAIKAQIDALVAQAHAEIET